MLQWIWDIIPKLDENEILSSMKAYFRSGKILQKCSEHKKD